MIRTVVALLLLAELPAASPARAAGRVSEFLGVKNWHGTVKVTGSGSGSTQAAGSSDIWQYGITSNASFVLDTYNASIQGWTGIFGGTCNLGATDTATFSGCTETFDYKYEGPLPAGKAFTMVLSGDNQYGFYPDDYQVQNADQTVTNTCAPGTAGGQGPLNWAPVMNVGNLILDLPASGFSLVGSVTVPMNSPGQPLSLAFGGDPAVINVTVSWDIEPGPVTLPEVVVQKSAAYESWRPTAGAGGDAGNSLDLTAKLQAQGGGPTNVKAEYFLWELTKTSHEPGYAMNAPANSPSTDFDLKLEGGPGNLWLIDPNAQKAQSGPGEYTQSTVTVRSYDWGAFGTIKVTAHLPDGSDLVGYLDGDSSQTNIRLPMRSTTSLIADVWKKGKPWEGLADATDNESDPVGDGNPGDGLSLYEEYRGFVFNGNHVEGNPSKKDFFVLNRAGVFYDGGIRLFQSLSGLAVHFNLRNGDLASDRVVNRNHGEGAHDVDEHGVVIVPIAANAGYLEAVGGPGTPSMISQVVAPRILPGASSGDIPFQQSSIAHELFHACNVFHHGDAGYSSTWITRTADGRLLSSPTNNGGGGSVNVLTEQNVSAAALFAVGVPTKVRVGLPGDPHTGDDGCVMRYDDANGHLKKGDPTTLYYYPTESAGLGLCSSPAGAGVNASTWQPEPRYGDAADGRGDCRDQILVNDAVAAPRR